MLQPSIQIFPHKNKKPAADTIYYSKIGNKKYSSMTIVTLIDFCTIAWGCKMKNCTDHLFFEFSYCSFRHIFFRQIMMTLLHARKVLFLKRCLVGGCGIKNSETLISVLIWWFKFSTYTWYWTQYFTSLMAEK